MHLVLAILLLASSVLVAADPPAPAAPPVPAFQKPQGEGWISLLEGDSPSAGGWTVEDGYWTLGNGVLVGDNQGRDSGRHHHAFHTRRKFLDYELHCELKKTGWNSGLLLHEQASNPNGENGIHPKAMEPWWGTAWTGTMDKAHQGSFTHLVVVDGWNHYYVKVTGGMVTIALNGVQTVEFSHERAKREGFIGIGLHHKRNTRVEVRQLVVRPIVAVKGP